MAADAVWWMEAEPGMLGDEEFMVGCRNSDAFSGTGAGPGSPRSVGRARSMSRRNRKARSSLPPPPLSQCSCHGSYANPPVDGP